MCRVPAAEPGGRWFAWNFSPAWPQRLTTAKTGNTARQGHRTSDQRRCPGFCRTTASTAGTRGSGRAYARHGHVACWTTKTWHAKKSSRTNAKPCMKWMPIRPWKSSSMHSVAPRFRSIAVVPHRSKTVESSICWATMLPTHSGHYIDRLCASTTLLPAWPTVMPLKWPEQWQVTPPPAWQPLPSPAKQGGHAAPLDQTLCLPHEVASKTFPYTRKKYTRAPSFKLKKSLNAHLNTPLPLCN